VPFLLGLCALALAAAGALPYAGSWNDGSRLAAVESLADRHTLAIDESLFCRPPAHLILQGRPPYPPDDADLLVNGTRDKLLIQGHFYSDKPAVITGLMAGFYRAAQGLGLPSAARRPDLFCWAMTLATAGLPFAFAVLALYFLGGEVGLSGHVRLAWVASFALSTYALAYTRHVNNHIMQLGAMALICWQSVRLAREAEAGRVSWLRLAGLGTLAGLTFNLDLGSGPLLLMALLGLVVYRCRRAGPVLLFLLAAAPWVAVGIGINRVLGGVWKPMNMVPEYSTWPGCPFTPENMTGFSRHGPYDLAVYTLSLLIGKKGFLVHNLPLLLGIPALAVLPRRSPHRPELLFAFGWCVAAWLLYAVLSNNYGGACVSIRWFVPFLAPGYYLLAVYLRQHPERFPVFLILSAWGIALAAIMWWKGPWELHLVPLLWPVVGAALLTWAGYRWWNRRQGDGMNVTRMRQIDRWLGVPVCFLLTCWRRCFDRRSPEPADRPHNILFIKLAEQGSTVLAQSALQAAIQRVGRDNVYFLLFAENRPILDILDLIPPENIIAIRTGGLFRTMFGAMRALWQLWRIGIEAVVDLEFFARSSAALAYLSGARRRAGYHAFGGEASYRGNLLTHRLSFNPYLHTSQTFQLLVEALDHPADRFPMFDLVPPLADSSGVEFVSTKEEVAEVRHLVWQELGRAAGHRLILLNANASDLMPLRRWDGSRYVELARRLLDTYGDVAILFTGAPSEAAAVEELVRRVGSPRCSSLAGKTTLRQLLVLYQLAEILVTNDSGPAHFATLTEIDVVVLFGPETPQLFAARSPRTHPQWARLACSPCINAFNDRNSSCRNNVCMQRITVDDVFAEVCRLAEARRRGAAIPFRVVA
jgi:ADP-heptose:LPS heptosyltransferase